MKQESYINEGYKYNCDIFVNIRTKVNGSKAKHKDQIFTYLMSSARRECESSSPLRKNEVPNKHTSKGEQEKE